MGFVTKKNKEHGDEHERHGVVVVVNYEGDSSKEKEDREKGEVLGGGLHAKDEGEDEESDEEEKAEEELEAERASIQIVRLNTKRKSTWIILYDMAF